MVKWLRALLLFIPLFFVQTDGSRADSCYFPCENAGSVLLGKKGLKRLFDERINSPAFKAQLKENMKKKFKKFPPHVLYETPDTCNEPSVGKAFDGLLVKLQEGLDGGCLTFPELDERGRFQYDTKMKRIKLQADQFSLEDIDFEFGEPEFRDGRYVAAIKITQLKLASRLAIVPKSKEGSKPVLESPNLLLIADSSKGAPPQVDVEVALDKNGRFDMATGELKNLKLKGDGLSFQHIMRDDKGQVLPQGRYVQGKYLMSSAERKRVKRIATSYQCDFFKDLFRKSSASELESYFADQRDLLIQERELENRWNLPQADLEAYTTATQRIVAAKRTGKKSISCRQKPRILNEFPDFQEVAQMGEYSAWGYSGKEAKSVFEMFVGVVNDGTLTNDEVMKGFIIPQVESQVLTQAKSELATALAEMGDEMRILMDQEIQMDVIDPSLEIRRGALEEEIRKKQNFVDSLKGKPGGHRGKTARSRLAKLKQLLVDLERKEQDLRTVNLMTRYTIDKVGDLNRIQLLYKNAMCPGMKSLPVGAKAEEDLKGHEFLFEFPMDSIQAYLDEMYRQRPAICADTVEKDCKNGTLFHLPGPPQIRCDDKTGQCRIHFGRVKARSDTLVGKVGGDFDFDVGVELAKCNDNSICMNFTEPVAENKKGFFLALKEAFGNTVEEDANEEMSKLRKEGGIDIGSALPTEIRDSFTFGDVVIRSTSIGIPMDMNSRENRLLFK